MAERTVTKRADAFVSAGRCTLVLGMCAPARFASDTLIPSAEAGG
jgi:hypothetical protein